MHVRTMSLIFGVLMACLGLALLLPLGASWFYADGVTDTLGYITVGLIAGGAGLVFACKQKEPPALSHREGLAVVGFAWMAASIIGGLPFALSGHMPLTDAVFESASGFTTTGASVLTDIEIMPKGLLLWRSLTQWLGGMGIIVLSLAILPLLGVGGMQLYKAEVPGPSPDKLTPRMRDTAMLLWKVYLLFTLLEVVLLWLAGMSAYDAVNHTFTTLATGGFSTKNASLAAFNQPGIQWIIIVFMFLAGINFALHYRLLCGDARGYVLDRECMAYAGIVLLCTLVVSAALAINGVMPTGSLAEAEALVRAAAFQVVSICTTTGFVTENYSLWPPVAICLIVGLMFMGGSAGSTSGGMKVMRLGMLVQVARREIFQLVHPHAVRHVKVGGKAVPVNVIEGVIGFVLLYMMILAGATLALTAMNLDLTTSFSAALTCLSNVGPGLGSVGPVDNFSHLPDAAKWLLSLCMLLGRLEIYAIFMLFVPEFWRR